MNQLSLHHLNQADRERDIAEDLRNRQILHAAAQPTKQPAPVAPATRPAPLAPRQGTTPVRARAAGR
jgi:hypothetical protein